MSESAADRLPPELSALTETLAEGDAGPAGGAVAGVVAALAAALAAAAADRSRAQWDEAAGARAQAQALRRRALALAERDADAYAEARHALAERGRESERCEALNWRLGQSVKSAANPPLELCAGAADITQLAALIAARAAPDVRADAAIAATLAAGATRAAAQLVEVNLIAGADEELVARARNHAEIAAKAAASATGGS